MEQKNNRQLRPIEAIFSCHVCHSPISEIYRELESDKGFRDTTATFSQRPVTKLWLTECGHLTCGKHLEGGGVPLHPSGQIPKAPCPLCAIERNNTDKKKLFGIRGCRDGEYDKHIPADYFNTPPIRLDSSKSDTEALRFQYLALARFATAMFSKSKEAEASLQALQEKYDTITTQRNELEEELKSQIAKVKDLGESDKRLKHWKEREPKILYYLGIFKQTVAENEDMRARLAAYGERLPPRPSALDVPEGPRPDGMPEPFSFHEQRRHNLAETTARGNEYLSRRSRMQQDTASSRTLSGPSTTLAPGMQSPFEHHTASLAQHSMKRTHDDGADTQQSPQGEAGRNLSSESRALMPPPPLPSKRARREVEPSMHSLDDRANDPQNSGYGLSPAKDVAFLQGQGRILLNSNGTWEQLKAAPQHVNTGEVSYGNVHRQRPEFEEDGRSSWYERQGYLTNDDDLHKSVPQRNIHVSPQRSTLVPTRDTLPKADRRQPYFKSGNIRRSGQSPRDSAPFEGYLGPTDEMIDHNIYHQQFQRQRAPLERLSQSRMNVRSYPQVAANSPRKREHALFDQYRYLDQPHSNAAYSSPMKSAQETAPSAPIQPPHFAYQPYQQSLTPSPTKQSIRNLADSVASPFFKTSTARDHTGRLTLQSRRPDDSVPVGLATPRGPQQDQYYRAPARPEVNGRLARTTPRESRSDLFSTRQSGAHNVPASPYFDRLAQQGPIAPRTNLFAEPRNPTTRRLTTQDFGVTTQRGTDIGRSGPSRMSLEGQRQGGGLGDYLARGGNGLTGMSMSRHGTGRGVRRLARR